MDRITKYNEFIFENPFSIEKRVTSCQNAKTSTDVLEH